MLDSELVPGRVVFWLDTWIGGCLQAVQFPERNLWICFAVLVIDELRLAGTCLGWETKWCQDRPIEEKLIEVESQFQNLLDILGDVYIPCEGNDRRIWLRTVEGDFSVASQL